MKHDKKGPTLEGLSPQEVVWRRIATEMFQQGASEDAVQQALRKAGCLALLRRQICEQTRHLVPVDRAGNRRQGLKAFLFGLGMCTLGLAIWTTMALAHANDPSGTGLVAGGRPVLFAAIGCVATGFTPLVFGLWKLLTGSNAAVVARRR